MFTIGDFVMNQHTQNMGRVIGFGQTQQGDQMEQTLKVLVSQSVDLKRRGFIEEDVHGVWRPWGQRLDQSWESSWQAVS